MKKVIILTEGGAGIGFGHIARCVALYQAFEQASVEVRLVINGDDSVCCFLDGIKAQMLDWLDIGVEKIVFDSDFVVVDSYLASVSFYESIEKNKLIIIDDYKRIDYPYGVVINPSIYGHEMDYPDNPDIKYLLGRDYVILRKEFWDIPKKKIRPVINNILVTFGGLEIAEQMYSILDKLKKDFNVHEIKPSLGVISAGQMLKLMLDADLAISGGGQTTYEMARVGVPSIGICFADNQVRNLIQWDKTAGFDYVGWYNHKGIEDKVFSVIKQLRNDKDLKKLSDARRSLIDGKGACRIVKMAIS